MPLTLIEPPVHCKVVNTGLAELAFHGLRDGVARPEVRWLVKYAIDHAKRDLLLVYYMGPGRRAPLWWCAAITPNESYWLTITAGCELFDSRKFITHVPKPPAVIVERKMSETQQQNHEIRQRLAVARKVAAT